MAQKNQSLAELTTLVEGIVAQVMNKSFGGQIPTWTANNPRTSLYLSHETADKNKVSGADQLFETMDQIASITKFINKYKSTSNKDLGNFGNILGGLSGVYGAYKSGNAIDGAMSGWQLGTALGGLGPWGAAAGLLAGLLSPGIDRWQRPKFKDAKQAFDKLFTMDRGERDDYYLPDSFYFRSGGNVPRNIVVKINDKKFDDHISESLTNNYATQLQRGLVF